MGDSLPYAAAVLEPQKYSERLGVIDPDQLYEVADRFDLGDVTGAEAAPGGLFGQNLFLTTTKGEFVLRGNPHGHVQLTKERRVAELINEGSSLPAPWPYEVCDDTSTFGWTYAVMPRLEGTQGELLWNEADLDDRVELAAACGEALAMLHETKSETFGPYDAQLDAFIALDDFPEWWLHRFEHWRSTCRAINAMSTEAERFIDDLLERCSPALAEPFRPVLVHHDFKLGNVNFDAEDYEPLGIFDLFEAYLADGEEDLVRMLWTVQRDEERRAFIEAYTDEVELRPGAGERLELYALADWLVIWEYGQRHSIWFGEASFIDTVKPILGNARKVESYAAS
jgi:aminoglycoside phosphotransferase (APT) family kinase protein